MTASSLRVSRRVPLPSPSSWVQLQQMPGGSWPSIITPASYYNGHTYFGYIDGGDGSVRVASFNHATHAIVTSPAIVSGFAIDLHSAPSVLVRSSDHKIVIAVAAHDSANLYIAVSTNAEDVTAWGTATDISGSLGASEFTYANLFQLSGESGKIYLFYRNQPSTTAILAMATSTDGGATWTAQTSLYENSTKGVYWSIGSDDTSRIDFVSTDGYAPSGDTASVYHFYYSGGSYFKSDGTLITASLPLAPSNLTKIYDGTTNGNATAVLAVVGGSSPVAVWEAANTAGYSGHPENYWYAAYSGGAWNVHKVDDAGAAPNGGLSSGGLTIDRTNISRLFVSRSPSSNYQMYLYETSDGGATWTPTALTADSGDTQNFHPISPRNAASGLSAIWCSGMARPEPANGGFAAQMRAYPNPVQAF